MGVRDWLKKRFARKVIEEPMSDQPIPFQPVTNEAPPPVADESPETQAEPIAPAPTASPSIPASAEIDTDALIADALKAADDHRAEMARQIEAAKAASEAGFRSAIDAATANLRLANDRAAAAEAVNAKLVAALAAIRDKLRGK